MKCGSLSERSKTSDRNSVGKIGQGFRQVISVGDLTLTKIRVQNFFTTSKYHETVILLRGDNFVIFWG